MRTILVSKVTSCIAVVSLVACPFVVSLAGSAPAQGGVAANSKTTADFDLRTKPETEKIAKATTLVRNTTPKADSSPTTSTAKEPQTHDKKTISRCWKRLMSMVREVNHAHKATNK